ncbi:Cytochrome c551/c552 [Kitasatospora purpeofusca]
MPSLLHYEIVADPTSLQASLPNEPSVGTVYLIVSNTHQAQVEWDYIDVALPLLAQSSNLTDTPATVTATVERTYNNPWDDALEFAWDAANDCFRARLSQVQPPSRQFALLDAHGALVLKLENIPVAEGAGLSLLEIRERAGGGDDNLAMRQDHYTTYLGLAKQTPRVPRNFRADRSLLDVDAGEQLVLRWDGPNGLDYAILDQTGAQVHSEPAAPGAAPAHQEYSWTTAAPKRGTTYTLVAKAAGGGQQRGYFLTTTVHAVIPEFASGTRTPWVEGVANKGRLVLAADGAEVRNPAGDLGRITADKADVDNVTTRLVQGRTDSAGWITFPDQGVNVYHGSNSDLGVLTAARADVEGVNTKWAGSRDAGSGWIEFTQPGATLHKDGNQDLGALTADKVDVEGVNTKWVGDRDAGKGWVGFPQDGIDIRKDGGQAWGTVHADKADVDGINTKWVQGRSTSDGWIEFPAEGVRVLRDGGHDLGTVTADKADLNGLNTKWVGDRDGGHGWVGFPQDGIDIRKDGGQAWGTVHADKADVDGINTKWVQGRSTSDGWIEFPAEGLRVLRDGGHDLGTVTAGKAELNELNTGLALVSGEARVRGMLSVGGGMKLSHDGTRMFVTMPDRIVHSAINDFKQWVGMERGLTVSFHTGSFSATKEGGILTSGCDVQFQQGRVSISTGNPPQVRFL